MQTETDYQVVFLIRWSSGKVWKYEVNFLSRFLFQQLMRKARFHPGTIANWIKSHSHQAEEYEQETLSR